MTIHLLSREVDFKIHRVNVADNSATFMLFNLSGQLVGWQKYSPNSTKTSCNDYNGRYYTYRSPNKIAIFGSETYDLKTKCIFLTEGIFDSTRLTYRGATAFALLTNSPCVSTLKLLCCLPQKKIAICDNDRGGAFLRKRLKGVADHFIVPSTKDLGEETPEFIENLIKQFDS